LKENRKKLNKNKMEIGMHFILLTDSEKINVVAFLENGLEVENCLE
jgi:hypothetical protein